ncbi:MAG: ATP-binding protein [Succinivibrio sp.]|nr:ATP-binding protein [Succinivibrio sp.]
MIKRDFYLKRLIAKRGNGQIKIITGIRRCGKSTLLFEIFGKWLAEHGMSESSIIKVNLDDVENTGLCDPLALYEHIRDLTPDPKAQYVVMLDEVQYAISRAELRDKDRPPLLYRVLNSLIHKHNLDVYVTGSNSKFLSTDVMTEFRGRGDEIHIQPLAFSEYLPAHGGDRTEAWSDYLKYGGMPYALSCESAEYRIEYLKRLNSEIYLKDISERYGISNAAGMTEILKTVASAIGSPTNPRRIASTFKSSGEKKLSEPSIARYLSCLADAFMIEKAERYDVKGRKYLTSPCKYYFTDLGLRNALLNFRQTEAPHLMENAIYNELIYRRYSVDVGVVPVSTGCADSEKRRQIQLEIDFVATKGDRRIYIQSAFAIPDEEKLAQEQASLLKTGDSFKKIIVVSAPSPVWTNSRGITIVNVMDFLTNPDPLDL